MPKTKSLSVRTTNKKTVVRDEKKKPVLYPGEDKQTKQWDKWSIDQLCQQATEDIQTMFRAGFKAVKLLAYIEFHGRWRELKEYKDKSFDYFVEDYFSIRPGTYSNMKGVAYKYGQENFDRWGYSLLKQIESTTNPQDVVVQLNTLYKKEGKRPKGKVVKEILMENRPALRADGVFTPKRKLLSEYKDLLAQKEDEIRRLRDKIVALEIKIEQLEDEIKRLHG